MPSVSFKSLQQSGKPILATFAQIPAAEVVEIIGCAGFHAAIVDGEHGMLGLDSARQLLRACDAAGLASIYRVPRMDQQAIGHGLDMGASAVMIPNIVSQQEGERAVQAAKYHPRGNRGVCPFTRAARYNAADADPDFYARANRETAVILQVEGLEGIANLERILAVPGVDCIFVGPFDLSQSLGIPGKVTDNLVLSEIERIVRQADAKGIAVGNFAITPAQAKRYLEIGVKLVAYGTDTLIASRAFTEACQAIMKMME